MGRGCGAKKVRMPRASIQSNIQKNLFGYGRFDGSVGDEKFRPVTPFDPFVFYTARCTLPALRQRVHTYARRTAPLMLSLSFCKFGRKTRRVLRFEWLTMLPVSVRRPQEIHILATRLAPFP